MNECIFIWENTRTVQGINDVDDVFVQRTSETKKKPTPPNRSGMMPPPGLQINYFGVV